MPTDDLVRSHRLTEPPAPQRRRQSAGERDRLVLEHLPVVRLIAGKIHDQLPELILEELVSAGIAGLISAVDHFDKTSRVKLEKYAEYRIRGAIIDSLRGLDWPPRRLRKTTEGLCAEQSFERKQRDIPELVWAHAHRTFGSASLAAEWFLAECGALGNRPPVDTIGDDGGALEIERILGCIDYGMIA